MSNALVKIFTRSHSRRDLGEIAARYGKSWRPKTRHDLAAILVRFGKSQRPKMRCDLGAILTEIAARYGNLGGQIRGEMLQRDHGKIRKSQLPKCAEIAR